MMSALLQAEHLSAHAVACPRCASVIGRPCVGPDGLPLMGYHLPRHHALAMLKRELKAWARELRKLRRGARL